MSDTPGDLVLLFERPREPLFMKRGQGKIRFALTSDYYSDRYKDLSERIQEVYTTDETISRIVINILLYTHYFKLTVKY